MRDHNRKDTSSRDPMTDLTIAGLGATARLTAEPPDSGSAGVVVRARTAPSAAVDGCRADPFASLSTPRRRRLRRLYSSYSLGAFVGLITYLSYAYLNQAWSNWALIGISFFMFVSLPLYSKYSNRIENLGTRLTQLETGGRVARYLFQLIDNIVLLWVYVIGGVIDPVALDGIGGFFATAVWITMVSQGGQYLANHLARSGFGNPDRNVVCAVAISVSVSALAVSGVKWIQPVYVVVSLGLGALIFGIGVMADTRRLLKRQKRPVFRPWI
jgi:hypothetical protein